jgi:hypothetical protein
MKTYALFAMLFLFSPAPSPAKIINGYERNVENARTSMNHLLNLPADKNVSKRLEAVKDFMLYYQLTQSLLAQFKMISPSLYHQLDTIIDAQRRPVDVYVKFVPKTDVPPGTVAVTNINRLENDQHAYFSEYGPNSVSVKITIVKNSLLILAHEFGHVAYQTPNLASYVDFFSIQYRDYHMKANYLGHKPNDPSGQKALMFERQFRKELSTYLESRHHSNTNPLSVLDQIVENIRNEFTR